MRGAFFRPSLTASRQRQALRHRITATLAAVCSMCGAGNAWGASIGFQPTDFGGSPIVIGAGARSLGMGGAFVAIADDATANTWNPAGMTQLDAPEVALSCGFYSRRSQRDGGDSSDQRVDLDHLSGVYPFHAFGFQQMVGIAWQRQYDFTFAQDFASGSTTGGVVTSVQSEQIDVRQRGAFSSLSISYAVEPLRGLSFGITGHAWSDRLTQHSGYRKDFTDTIETTSTLTSNGTLIGRNRTVYHATDEIEVNGGYSVNLGVWWQALPSLTVGITWKPRYTLHITDRFSSTQVDTDLFGSGGTTVQPSQYASDDARMTFPTSAALGTAWRLNDLQTIACDVTWTRWREYAVDRAGVRRSPISPFVPSADFKDTLAIRLGYEHILILPGVVLVPRCGALYEAIPGITQAPSTTQINQVGATTDKYYGVTAGLSAFQRTVIYDVAGQFRYGSGVGSGSEASPTATANVTSITIRAGVAVQF